ncbi:MAG: PD-(D/E)XK nuclease family protein [Endomicrobia bacterium]|nr:PD-(D/E)XK nuclease family protein [Endomicrobiia bacterium]MCL2507210.1 PD-(D/E)XK nuclease family protein [Endomicrobiia bacterium]
MQLENSDFLESLYEFRKNYGISKYYESVFTYISDTHYHENYHSDILAYFLKDNTAKEEFIEFIKDKFEIYKKQININFDDYKDGEVLRESGRIDILLYSRDKKKAIVIENKSNKANDMYRQLYGYFEKLDKKEIDVQAIVYLNKESMKEPDFSNFTNDEKREISKRLVITYLGDNSFEKFFDGVSLKSDNTRTFALSKEIKNLFNYIVYGGMNMDNMEDFAKHLSKNGNLQKLEQIMDLYRQLPVFLAKYCQNKITEHAAGYNTWYYKSNYPVIDIKSQDGKIYAVDICCSAKSISFEIFIRPKPKENPVDFGRLKAELESLKKDAGKDFPFDTENYRGYIVEIEHNLDIHKIDDMIDKVLYMAKKYIK